MINVNCFKTAYTKQNDVIWREKFVNMFFFYNLDFEIIVKCTQEHWKLSFVEIILFPYTVLKWVYELPWTTRNCVCCVNTRKIFR